MTRDARRVRSLLVAGALLVAAGAFPPLAEAQYFGRNKVQYRAFDFEVLRTEHFDIYYYKGEEEVVREAARMAERWYARIARLLDHQLRGRQPLILYASHPDFEQTNAIFGEIGESTGGVTEVFKRRIVLPLAGPLKESDHVLGHELVHAFQFDITSVSARGGVGFRGPTALYLPLWFIEGMAEYLSVGPVDAHTAMWMRDAAACDCKLPTLRDLSNPYKYFPYRWGQAFWAFVAGNWGDEAVGKVLKVAGRSGNPAQALEAVLQTDIPTLEAEWHASIRDMYASVAGEEALPTEEVDEPEYPPHEGARLLVSKKTGSGALNVGPALSPDGSQVVYLSEKSRFSIEMFLADAQTGEVVRRLTKTATDPHFESLQFINSAGAWSPDGQYFAFGAVTKGKASLVILDVARGTKVREIAFPDLGEVYTPTFSPDGRRIAFSALVGGHMDLFVVDLEGESPRRLTRDLYADLQPAWSPDGAVIAFVTDRFSSDLENLQHGNYRLATIDPATGEIQALPVFGKGKHINPQWSADGQSLYFVTDVSGISNVYRYAFQGGTLHQVTDLSTGVSGITALSPVISTAARADRLVYTAYERGDYNLYTVDTEERLAGTPIEAAIPGVSPAVLPPKDRSPGLVSVLLDEPALGLADTLTFTAADYKPRLSLDYVSQPTLGAGVDQFGGFVAGGVSLFFSDMLGNRNLGALINVNTAYGDITRSTALLASYENRRSRWNWGIIGGQVPYITRRFATGRRADGLLVDVEDRFFQVNRQVAGLVAYPFNRAQRVEFSAGFQNIDFAQETIERLFACDAAFFNCTLLDERTTEQPSLSSLNLGVFEAAVVYDNAIFGGTGPILGQRYRVAISPRIGDLNYYGALIDYRRYFMWVRPTTFAARILGYGRFGQDAESNRLSDLYLGYPWIMRGYNDGSFSFAECLPEVNTDGSCPAFEQLFGSRLAVANFEYRIPLLGFFGLIPSPGVPPLEFALFFDAGLAWQRGIDLEFSCDVNFDAGCERQVVTSHGIAARLNLLGFLIMELDYVHPNDRPEKGWYWQFSLIPAF